MKMMSATFAVRLALLLTCFVIVPRANGVTLLSEDWEAEIVGDDLGELTNWNSAGTATDGVIIDASGDKQLSVDSTTAAGISQSFDMTPYVGGTISIKARMSVDAASKWAYITLRDNTATGDDALEVYRLQFNYSINSGTLKRQDESSVLGGSFTLPAAGGFHDWELRITQDGSGLNTLEAYIDDVQVVSKTETVATTGVVFSNSMSVAIQGFNGDGNKFILGDVLVSATVPEPSSAILALLGGLGMIGFSRRCRR